MGTQLIQLLENVWVIQGGANIGVIAHDGRCLIIDSGMEWRCSCKRRYLKCSFYRSGG